MDIVLYQPEIPQNTGNIARTCVATDCQLWLVKPLGFRMTDKHIRRAGLDYWQHLSLQTVTNWDELTQRLAGRRFWYFSRQAERPHSTADFAANDVLVFGSESSGLPNALRENSPPQQWLRIPTSNKVRSLNLACTVAVAIFEARRQLPATE
jgi:tRNA (cytidine/uridine-2'-O-)-methyltransferase